MLHYLSWNCYFVWNKNSVFRKKTKIELARATCFSRLREIEGVNFSQEAATATWEEEGDFDNCEDVLELLLGRAVSVHGPGVR